jgi:hypothetical protein
MNVHWRISAPAGDITPAPELLNQPYRISLSRQHPSLTLGDYFDAAERFVTGEHLETVAKLLSAPPGQPVTPRDMTDILIRSEKHGALYHIASVEAIAGARSVKFALSAAVTHEGKQCLARESDLLAHLDRDFGLPYLPKPFFFGKSGVRGRDAFSMLAAQWFEGFSEWHLSVNPQTNRQGLIVWDGKSGNRWAGGDELFEIYRKSAVILTRYYDAHTYRQIHPWRHAAGDFVVKSGADGVDVRLTTARSYVSIMARISEGTVHPMIALVYFFLDLVTRMRVDRLDGTGPTAWAPVPSLKASVAGFFGALSARESGDADFPGKATNVLGLLKKFDREELKRLFGPLLSMYASEDPEMLEVIGQNLPEHTDGLYRIIQDFHPSSLETAP